MYKLKYSLSLLLLIAMTLLTLRPQLARAAAFAEVQPGSFSSDPISSGDSEGQTVTLDLYEDGTALLIYSDSDGTETMAEFGEWTEESDQITLTITGSDSEEYDEPIEVVLDVQDETLVTSEFDEDKFGTDGLTFERVAESSSDNSAEDSLTFESQDAVDADGNEIKVTLHATGVSNADKGDIILTTENAEGETIVEVGTWTQEDSDSNQVSITLMGTEEKAYDEPVEITLVLDDNEEVIRLTNPSDDRYGEDGIALKPNLDSSASSGDSSSSSEDDTSTPPGIYYSPSLMKNDDGNLYAPIVQLAEDGSVQWNTNYFDGTPSVSEVGTWELAEDGTLTINVTGALNDAGEVQEHDKPIVITFDFGYDSLNNYDVGLYMYKFSDPYESSSDSSSGSSSDESSTSDESSSASQALVYESNELEDGSVLSIEFSEDGSAVMTTTYANGDPDLVEVAEYTIDEKTDELTLTITGTEDEEYADSIEWVFDAASDTLTATEWDTDLYGEEAPEFQQVSE